MQVFISRKKQSLESLIDFKNAFHLNAILVCSEKHTIIIEQYQNLAVALFSKGSI